ncbi:MAG: Ni/Fe hydrogenase subunit alpha [Planctomycetota bacterium]
MAQTITIAPVTRIEGHARITIDLDDAGQVADAHFHVTQFRGFEKFCEGRPFTEMPALTARTCGICPVSHLMASSKACDDLMAVTIPPTAVKLRRVMNLAQIMQSHALSFFHLSSPDMLLGWDSDPARRHVLGVAADHPQIALDGIRLRQIGQGIIEILGGKKVHPAWMVGGGVNAPLNSQAREQIAGLAPEALEIARRNLGWFKRSLDNYHDEAESFANFPSLFLGLVDGDGGLEHYDGQLRLTGPDGLVLEDGVEAHDYGFLLGEAVEDYSYMKFPYYKKRGYPDGMYRVGPLARLNLADYAGTSVADQELVAFRQLRSGAVLSSFHYHYARLIEVIFAAERIAELMDDPDILDPHVRAKARSNRNVGIGVAEAPRGTLIHHYEIDDDGRITRCNLIIATGHNNLAMNAGVKQVAERFVSENHLEEGALNRVEAVIRCFDPCLSCATHALGQMPMRIELRSVEGVVVDAVQRD